MSLFFHKFFFFLELCPDFLLQIYYWPFDPYQIIDIQIKWSLVEEGKRQKKKGKTAHNINHSNFNCISKKV